MNDLSYVIEKSTLSTYADDTQIFYADNELSKAEVIYQTLKTVFHRDIQTPIRELNIRRAAEYFDEIRGVWIADETLSRVFDISSQITKR